MSLRSAVSLLRCNPPAATIPYDTAGGGEWDPEHSVSSQTELSTDRMGDRDSYRGTSCSAPDPGSRATRPPGRPGNRGRAYPPRPTSVQDYSPPRGAWLAAHGPATHRCRSAGGRAIPLHHAGRRDSAVRTCDSETGRWIAPTMSCRHRAVPRSTRLDPWHSDSVSKRPGVRGCAPSHLSTRIH